MKKAKVYFTSEISSSKVVEMYEALNNTIKGKYNITGGRNVNKNIIITNFNFN